MPRNAQAFVSLVLGFFMVCNVFLLPGVVEVRATDALGVLLGLWLLWRFSTRGLTIVPFVFLFAFGITPLFWGLITFFNSDQLTTTLSIRWLLAAPWGSALFILTRNRYNRTSLAWGLWWGCVANVVVLLLQFYDLEKLTENIGLAAQASWVIAVNNLNATPRVPGMHYHPNSSAAIVSLIVPISLYLYYTRKAGVWVVVAGLGILLAGTELTLSRAPLLVSLATILAFLIANTDLRPSLRLIAPFVLGGLPLLFSIGPPGGWERWLNPGNLETNSSERLTSQVEAVRIALEHPLGTGWEAGVEALRHTGFPAMHNAFLQIAVMYGLLLAVALTSLMLILALQMLRGPRTPWRLEAALAFQLFGLFLWEEHLNNASFIVLTSWLIAAGVAVVSARRLKQRTSTWPTPAKQRASEALQ